MISTFSSGFKEVELAFRILGHEDDIEAVVCSSERR